ncbi:DUF5007 domain-containing protein [Chitinophaga sp. YIM B06452]|uniref:DUF5007 domain-containing protein n=1 Tax=Chitinophaga sp. YIM B06452 TaxID=3082158 RepID=UPI0031FF3E4B
MRSTSPNIKQPARRLLAWAMLGLVAAVSGCYKELLPEEQDHFSKDMNYTVESFLPNLGKTNVFINVFNADFSTQPLDFSIENPRYGDKSPANFLLDSVDTRQWKTWYAGNEASIQEIENKMYTIKRPILDIRPNSGEIIFWNVDSNKVRYGKYYFDVRVKNKAGERVFSGLLLDVRRPRPYEPYIYDDATGLQKGLTAGGIVKPTGVVNFMDELLRPIPKDSVDVYFVKEGTAKNSISFKFYNKDSAIIPLTKFNFQQWDSLFYFSKMAGSRVRFGFNRQMNADSTKVTFDITNPFPVLSQVSGGLDVASIAFNFTRISFGRRISGGLGLDFSINEPGEWTAIVKFRVTPKFSDD